MVSAFVVVLGVCGFALGLVDIVHCIRVLMVNSGRCLQFNFDLHPTLSILSIRQSRGIDINGRWAHIDRLEATL